MKKTQLLSLTFCFVGASLFNAQAQKSAQGSTFSDKGINFNAISDNGLWIVGNGVVDGTDMYPTLWDVKANSAKSLAASDDFLGGVNDVSNDGCAVGQIEGDFFNAKPAYYKNGVWHKLPIPDGFSGGSVNSVTPDGRVMVGFVIKYPGGTGLAGYDMLMAKWTDGNIETFEAPADKFGSKSMNDVLLGISPDGSKTIGHLAMSILPDLTPFYNDNGEYSIIGEEIYQREDNLSVLEIMSASHDYKWITGHIEYDTYYEQEEYGAWSIFRHFVYNTETKELILDLKKGPSGMGTVITKEGVNIIACPHNYPFRQSYLKIPGDETYRSFTQYIQDEYNFNVGDLGCSELGTVRGMSEDGKTLFGFESPGNNWVLKLSEPIMPEGVTALDHIRQETGKMNAFVYGRDLIISGDVESFAVMTPDGRTLINAQYSGQPASLSGFNKGVYLVVLNGGNGQVSNTKIVLR